MADPVRGTSAPDGYVAFCRGDGEIWTGNGNEWTKDRNNILWFPTRDVMLAAAKRAGYSFQEDGTVAFPPALLGTAHRMYHS
jgi:hypothetical protein